jgi:hypothetical protein
MTSIPQGPNRIRIDANALSDLTSRGLVFDDRRRRPLYFDGRFLAARDLTREQNYFLARQAELARAIGAGVAAGLEVSRPAEVSASILDVSAGHGFTLAGELVALQRNLRVDLADLALGEELDASFGLRSKPRPPSRSRTGLFLLAIRPVEFAANPIAAYPTSLDGRRSTQLGDIVEAAAVTLIPYPDRDGRREPEPQRVRARAAREIFVEGVETGVPADAIPLAVVALDRGLIDWLDPHLVRRELGRGPRDVLGLGIGSAELAEAYLRQYDAHLADVREVSGDRFVASQFFDALPAAGPLPRTAVDAATFRQGFFPPEIECQLSLVPNDELGPIVEESFAMPPIDLTLGEVALESTSVQILVPVARAVFHRLSESIRRPRRLFDASPSLSRTRTPKAVLQNLRAPLVRPLPRPLEDPADAAWQQALASAGSLYYVRTRNLTRRTEVVGVAIDVGGTIDEFEREERLRESLADRRLRAPFDRLADSASADGRAELVRLLASEPVRDSELLTEAVLRDLESRDRVDRPAVFEASRLASPESVEAIERIRSIEPRLVENTTAINNLTSERLLPDLVLLASQPQPTEALRTELAEISRVARRRGPAAREELRTLVRERVAARELVLRREPI